MFHTDKTVGILHHTGGGNLGDDAIVDVVIGNIRRRWLGAEIVIFSMNPEDTEERHGVASYPIRQHRWGIGYQSGGEGRAGAGRPAVPRWLARTRNPLIRLPRAAGRELLFVAQSFRRLRRCDLLVVSGGGQLTERGGPWSFPYALFVWTLLAKLAGVRCLFLNVGAGPLRHPVSRFFVKRALLGADYVSFRDQQSQSLANSLGFSGPSQVFPDNVFSLEAEAPENRVKRELPVVGIAPMPFPFSDLLTPPQDPQAIQEELIEKMATFASLVAEQSCSLQLFGSDAGADPAEIEHLRGVLAAKHGIQLPEYVPIESVGELLSRMAAMDYVITCRFHGVVFALLLNKPVLAISHHPKVAELMKTLGLSRYCVDMRSFDPVALAERFQSLVREADGVRHRMSASLTRFRSQLTAQFDDLFSPQTEPAVMQRIIPGEGEALAVGQERHS